MAKDRKDSEKRETKDSEKREADDISDSGLIGGLKERRKAMERGNPEDRSKAFQEGLSKPQSGDGTGGAKEDD